MHSSCDCMSHLCPAYELPGDSYVAAEWDNDLTRRLDFWHTKFPFASRFQRRLQLKHILHQGPRMKKKGKVKIMGFGNEWAVTKSKLKPSPWIDFLWTQSSSSAIDRRFMFCTHLPMSEFVTGVTADMSSRRNLILSVIRCFVSLS